MRWISIDDRLPEIEQDVLLWTTRSREVRVGWRCESNEWATWSEEFTDVSHWMPLPSPPSRDAAFTSWSSESAQAFG